MLFPVPRILFLGWVPGHPSVLSSKGTFPDNLALSYPVTYHRAVSSMVLAQHVQMVLIFLVNVGSLDPDMWAWVFSSCSLLFSQPSYCTLVIADCHRHSLNMLGTPLNSDGTP